MSNYFSGQGKVFIKSKVSGGWKHVGDADKFVLEISQKFDDVHESMSGSRLVALHIPTETVPSIKMNLLEWSVENLVRAVYGSSEGAKTAGTVTAEAVSAYAGSFAFLKHLKVSSVVLKQGATTLVEGTDYRIDLNGGAIEFLSGSTIVTGSSAVSLTADYSYAAYAGKVEGMVGAMQEYEMKFVGKNIADSGAPVVVDIKRAALNLPKNLQFLDSKHGSLELDGMMLYDATVGAGESAFFSITKAS